jgi:NAD(P)-dependent dehydrogenase (short-subunit alcohol dehydrogenase family)
MGARVVVVTGASAGVGRATARAFADRGDQVALLARGEAGLEQAVDGINGTGGTATGFAVDVSDPEAVEAAADRIERELGPIDVWVNNAFSTVFAPFTEISAAEFRRVTETTYLGYVHGTKAALARMLSRDRGVVVHVGSALAYRAIPLQSAYCAAKHAIKAMHESLRCELLHDGSGVATTMVQLPALNTPQFDWALSRMRRRAQPVPPIFQPEVAARMIVYAADHPHRREFWVGFSTVATILAERVAPGLVDRYLARTGYESQQTDRPESADRPANLWEPVDDEPDRRFAAHGRFDDRAKSHSLQAWLSRHRPALGRKG